MIKAIIFDLDDTLLDQRILREKAMEQSLKIMIENGLKCSFEEGLKKFKEIIKKNPFADKFTEIVLWFNTEISCKPQYLDYEISDNNNFNDQNNEIVKSGKDAYLNANFDELEIYSDVIDNLKELKNLKLFLVTNGSFNQQNKKIDILKIRNYFDEIFINEKKDKTEIFRNIMYKFSFSPREIMVVGDKIDKEIRNGNELGMITVRILRGIYSNIDPQEKLENPEYVINNLNEIFNIINNNNNNNNRKVQENENNKKENKQLKIVAIGGGTGLPTIAEGIRKYTDDITLIVTVTDSGRSSGILRKELNVLPPGDIRNCLISLSNSEELLCNLFQYRFDNGSLQGHNFGNLFIAALSKLTGSFEKAIEEISKILKLKGKVLASTFDNVNICAELENGQIIEEEDKIVDRKNNEVHLRSPIKRVFLKPFAKSNEQVLQAIKDADLIVICPGSLFTSILPNLLIEDISNTINKSKAEKVYVCNVMTQVSQTYNYRASDHVKRILEYVNLNHVILNTKIPDQYLLEAYKKENAYLVENDIDEIENLGIKVTAESLLDDISEKKLLWEKRDLLRHDPEKIAKVLIGLVR